MWRWLIGMGVILSGHHYIESNGKLYDPEQKYCHGKFGLVLFGLGSVGWLLSRFFDEPEPE